MDINDVITKQVSFQSNAWSPIEKEISVAEVIRSIKNGKYSNEIRQLRFFLENDEKEKYDTHKKRLPGVTFCANFLGNRKKELIKSYHNLLVIDIDKLEDDELERTKNILNEDKYVFTFWTSPSKNGMKGLIYLEFKVNIELQNIDNAHKHAFKQVTNYFKTNYSIELDISGSDTTRLCFLSYDPDLVFKKDIVPFFVEETTEELFKIPELPIKDESKEEVLKILNTSLKNLLNNPKNKNKPRAKKTIIKIIKYLKRNSLSITSTYDNWYRVAYAIADSFTYDIGQKYFLSLCELDGSKHDEIQSKNMLLYCYQHSQGLIKFRTITFLAKINGFII